MTKLGLIEDCLGRIPNQGLGILHGPRGVQSNEAAEQPHDFDCHSGYWRNDIDAKDGGE